MISEKVYRNSLRREFNNCKLWYKRTGDEKHLKLAQECINRPVFWIITNKVPNFPGQRL